MAEEKCISEECFVEQARCSRCGKMASKTVEDIHYCGKCYQRYLTQQWKELLVDAQSAYEVETAHGSGGDTYGILYRLIKLLHDERV